MSRLAQLVERVTSNDEVSRSSRLMGMKCVLMFILLRLIMKCLVQNWWQVHCLPRSVQMTCGGYIKQLSHMIGLSGPSGTTALDAAVAPAARHA